MSDHPDNVPGALRCASCGRIDVPTSTRVGRGWIALAGWAAAGALWAIGFLFVVAWLWWVAALVFLAAFIYTLWYFFRREQACRHCGARTLELGRR